MMCFKSHKYLKNVFLFFSFFLHPISSRIERQNARLDDGFTLMEVLFAMMIASLTLAPLFSMFTTIMNRVNKSSRAYDYILVGKNFLYESRQKQEATVQSFSFQKEDPFSGASLTYSLDKNVDQKSSLSSLQGLHREIVIISWQENDQKKEERLIGFIYKKPEQKKS